MGHGVYYSHKYTPTIIQYFVTNNIAISQIYSIFLTTDGNVYSCGYSSNGQLGHGDTSDKYLLYHNSLEGHRYDNIYRGKKVISGGDMVK